MIGGAVLLLEATTMFGELRDVRDRGWRAPAKKMGRRSVRLAPHAEPVARDASASRLSDGLVVVGTALSALGNGVERATRKARCVVRAADHTHFPVAPVFCSTALSKCSPRTLAQSGAPAPTCRRHHVTTVAASIELEAWLASRRETRPSRTTGCGRQCEYETTPVS